jgi:hypothetical protein
LLMRMRCKTGREGNEECKVCSPSSFGYGPANDGNESVDGEGSGGNVGVDRR